MNFSSSQLKTNGIVYGLCGHSFHIECLVDADASPCPMCRYILSPKDSTTCKYCTSESDLWVCLICGEISCGIDSSNHRMDHYLNTKHQHCKLISGSETFDFTLGKTLEAFYGKKTVLNEVIDADEKIGSVLSEYNSIITMQLELQRMHYVRQIKNIEAEYQADFIALGGLMNKLEIERSDLESREVFLTIEKNKEYERFCILNGKLKKICEIKQEEEKLFKTVEIIKSEHESRLCTTNIEDSLNLINKEISMLREQIKEVKININLKDNLKGKQTENSNVIIINNKRKK